MNKDQFHQRIKEILSNNRGEHDSPSRDFHDALSKEVVGRSGKDWDDEVAAQVIREFEWATNTPPRTIELPEDEIKDIIKTFLVDRGYTLAQIPEQDHKTPDCYIENEDHKYLSEIKSPVLGFDTESGVYKFKTTHRKILNFIHTAVKQFEELDSGHRIPRVLVYASVHPQLNRHSFMDALQGGVVGQGGSKSPDFSKTPTYTSTLPLLPEVDMYVWFQVSNTHKNLYQVTYFINEDSTHVSESLDLAKTLSRNRLSSMDGTVLLKHNKKTS